VLRVFKKNTECFADISNATNLSVKARRPSHRPARRQTAPLAELRLEHGTSAYQTLQNKGVNYAQNTVRGLIKRYKTKG